MRVLSTGAFSGFSIYYVGGVSTSTSVLVFPTNSAEARLLTRAYRWHLEVDATQSFVTVHSQPPDQASVNGNYVWSVSAGNLSAPGAKKVRWGFASVGATPQTVGWPQIFLLDASVWPDWAPKDNQLLDMLAAAGAARRSVRVPPRSDPAATQLDFPRESPPPLPFDERSAAFFHAHDDLYVKPGEYQSFLDGLTAVFDARYGGKAYRPVTVTQSEANALEVFHDASYLSPNFTCLSPVQWATPDLRYVTVSLDVHLSPPPIALVTLASMPRLAARLAQIGLTVNAANIGRVRISLSAAEVTATEAPVRPFMAYAGPTQFVGSTFRWAIAVWDPATNGQVAAVGAGNQLSLSITGHFT